MPRIAVDATPLIGIQTGIGTYTLQLLNALTAPNERWEVVTLANKALPAPFEALHIGRHFSLSRWLWMQFMLPFTLLWSKVDLAHFPNSIAPLFCPVPYVVTIHDMSLFTHTWTHPPSRIVTMKWLLPFIARRARHIITVSEFSKSEIHQVLGIPRDKITVVHETAGPEFRPIHCNALLEDVRSKYALPRNMLLYVGTLEPRKNLARLLSAFEQMQAQAQEWHLVLAGAAGYDSETILAQAAQISNVHYLGYVAQEDLPAVYNCAQGLVLPSLHEGFGLPPLEALACGIPVLTSNTSALQELYAENGLSCDPLDVADISAQLMMLTQLHSAQRTIDTAQETIPSKLGPRIFAHAVIDVHKSMLGDFMTEQPRAEGVR